MKTFTKTNNLYHLYNVPEKYRIDIKISNICLSGGLEREKESARIE
jgi:hypothetical protein